MKEISGKTQASRTNPDYFLPTKYMNNRYDHFLLVFTGVIL